MASMSPSERRLQKELMSLMKEPPPGVEVDGDQAEQNLSLWTVHMKGAEGTLYEGEVFQLQFKFSPKYPFDSPEVTFIGSNIPVHPHVYSNGHICLSILTDDWSPALSVQSVCLSIVSMLSSCKEKKRPPDNSFYVKTCNKNPKKTKWWYHGLLVTLMMYTILGGLLFYELEYPEEVNNLRRFEKLVREERQAFVEAVSVQLDCAGAHNETTEHAQTQLEELLARYERAVQEAASSGVLVPLTDQRPVHELTKWTQLQAIFFAVTVLTTIGYGNVAPATSIGRGCCMLFALVGIPLTVTVIADVGRLMASALPPPLTAPAPRHPFVSAIAALALLLLFLAVGACFFAVLEPSWRFFDAFYFCFITMTTIGFGDLVPQTPEYMLVCTVYIVAGLGLTSTIIELVRQQYARSWRQLQALAEMLARLADDADRTPTKAGRDLIRAELRRAAVALQDKAGWQQAVDRLISDIKRPRPAPPPPVIQIVVYESSV